MNRLERDRAAALAASEAAQRKQKQINAKQGDKRNEKRHDTLLPAHDARSIRPERK